MFAPGVAEVTDRDLYQAVFLANGSTYLRTTEARLDASALTSDAGVLLAPDLSAVVVRANALYAEVGDAAAKQLTQPRATPTPTMAPSPSPTSRP